MSLKIEIVLPDGEARREVLADHMRALGFDDALDRVLHGNSDSAQTAPQADVSEAKPEPKPRSARKQKPPLNISATPEDRQPPDPADEAADAADEAAEASAGKDEGVVTPDDIRALMITYRDKFGLAEVQEDGPELLNDVLGAPPVGETAWKISLIAALPQEKLRDVRNAWAAAAHSDSRYEKGRQNATR